MPMNDPIESADGQITGPEVSQEELRNTLTRLTSVNCHPPIFSSDGKCDFMSFIELPQSCLLEGSSTNGLERCLGDGLVCCAPKQ